MTNSLNYKVWISGLGETDVSGSNRIISTQPHLKLHCLNHKTIQHGLLYNQRT